MKRIITLLSAFILLCSFPLTTYAVYDFEHYESMSGDYIVKDYDENADCNATLYLYTDVTNRSIKSVANTISFYYTAGPALQEDDNIAGLVYKFNPMNAKVYATLPSAEVWAWQFSLEHGEYSFAQSGGSTGYGTLPPVYFLKEDFELPREPEDYFVTQFLDDGSEFRMVETPEIRLYAMYGSEDWIDEHHAEFKEWAMALDKELSAKSEIINNEIERVEETPEEEYIPEEITEETTEIIEIEVEEEVIEEQIVIPTTENTEEVEEPSKQSLILKVIIGAFVLIGAIIICRKYK